MSTSAEELSTQAEKLYESISFFKTSKDEFDQQSIDEIEEQIKKFQNMLVNLKKKDEKNSGIKKIKSEKSKEIEKKTKSKKEIDIKLNDTKLSDNNYEKY